MAYNRLASHPYPSEFTPCQTAKPPALLCKPPPKRTRLMFLCTRACIPSVKNFYAQQLMFLCTRACICTMRQATRCL